MAIRNILGEKEPTLRKISRKVDRFDSRLITLIEDMEDTLREADGVGLAAPQVGVLKRIFIIVKGDGFQEFVNPELMEPTGTQSYIEGCLSVPGVHGMTERPQTIRVKALDRFGKPFEFIAEGTDAVVVSHENDHLDGVLFIDHARILSDEEIEEMLQKNGEEDI